MLSVPPFAENAPDYVSIREVLHERSFSTADDDVLHRRLGTRLRWARKRSGMSQIEASRAIGISYQQYQKYEHGQNRISAVYIYKLAQTFDVEARWFFAGLDEELTRAELQARYDGQAHQRLLSLLHNLGDRDQQFLLAFGDRLAKSASVGRPTASAAQHRSDRLEKSRGRILLVDDDIDALQITSIMLRKAGFNTQTALSGDDALQILATNERFDALVTDYAMPGLNGLALIELALERDPSLPTLMITGYGGDTALDRLPRRVGVLAKPFTSNDLIQRLEHLVRPPAEDLAGVVAEGCAKGCNRAQTVVSLA